MYTDRELEDLQFGEEYATWLCENAMDYGVVICNGDTLTVAQEKAIGFEDFLKTLEGTNGRRKS